MNDYVRTILSTLTHRFNLATANYDENTVTIICKGRPNVLVEVTADTQKVNVHVLSASFSFWMRDVPAPVVALVVSEYVKNVT